MQMCRPGSEARAGLPRRWSLAQLAAPGFAMLKAGLQLNIRAED
jgi:hypothetical protein